MPKPDLPYLCEDVDRHGNVRVYVRRKGIRKIRLHETRGTSAFLIEYQTALAIVEPPEGGKKGGVTITRQGTFRWLCDAYFASSEYFTLDVSTRLWRRRALDAVCLVIGAHDLKHIAAKQLDRLRDAIADKPGASRNRVKALKAVFGWGYEKGSVAHNPARDVRVIRYLVKGHHTWTADEIETFRRHYAVGSRQRLAMELMLHTTCRREDAVRLGPKHVKSGRLRYTQAKNEGRKPVHIDIEVPPPLRPLLAIVPARQDTFLQTDHGKPYSVAGFGIRFREWCDAAGLPQCSAHGLRKAGAVDLAENGATAHEIGAITGHVSLDELERYTRAANRLKLADGAMAKRYRVPPSGVPLSAVDEKTLDLALPRGVKQSSKNKKD